MIFATLKMSLIGSTQRMHSIMLKIQGFRHKRYSDKYSNLKMCPLLKQYLNKHYSHYLTRLASDDLTKMNAHIGLGGKIISMGEDFTITDMTA